MSLIVVAVVAVASRLCLLQSLLVTATQTLMVLSLRLPLDLGMTLSDNAKRQHWQ